MQYETTSCLDLTKPLETHARIAFDINNLLIMSRQFKRFLFFSHVFG